MTIFFGVHLFINFSVVQTSSWLPVLCVQLLVHPWFLSDKVPGVQPFASSSFCVCQYLTFSLLSTQAFITEIYPPWLPHHFSQSCPQIFSPLSPNSFIVDWVHPSPLWQPAIANAFWCILDITWQVDCPTYSYFPHGSHWGHASLSLGLIPLYCSPCSDNSLPLQWL